MENKSRKWWKYVVCRMDSPPCWVKSLYTRRKKLKTTERALDSRWVCEQIKSKKRRRRKKSCWVFGYTCNPRWLFQFWNIYTTSNEFHALEMGFLYRSTYFVKMKNDEFTVYQNVTTYRSGRQIVNFQIDMRSEYYYSFEGWWCVYRINFILYAPPWPWYTIYFHWVYPESNFFLFFFFF